MADKDGGDMNANGPSDADMSSYFCTYQYLYHQKQMIEDTIRTGAYNRAILTNAALFKDKVVMDVGAGTGILSIFAAQAGAKKVYAVEATNMAKHARKLIEANGFGDVIEVHETMVENLRIDEQVDVIVSEWMGYFLLRESMLESVLHARDKFLKPGGSLFPSHCSIMLAPVRYNEHGRQASDHDGALDDWDGFIESTRSLFNVDLDCLTKDFKEETKEYFLETAVWCDLRSGNKVGPSVALHTFDLHTVTAPELVELNSTFSMTVNAEGCEHIDGFVGWFDADFKGSEENPAPMPVTLSTAPGPQQLSTHWGQLSFLTHPYIYIGEGERIEGTSKITKRGDNKRLLALEVDFATIGADGERRDPRKIKFHVD